MSSPTILITLMGLDIGGVETHVIVLCKQLKDLGYNIIIASNGGVFEKEMSDYGIKHYKVFLNTKNPYKVWKSFVKLLYIIKHEKVDLIHAHARIPAFICNIISKIKGIPFITTGHYNFKSNFILRHISAWGEKTIVVSEDLKQYFKKVFGIPEEKMTIITNGIDTERFKPGVDCQGLYDEFGVDKSCKKILLVSRIDDNLAEIMFNLINTANKLESEFANIAIFIVGTGNRFQEVNDYAAKKNEELGKPVVFVTGGRTDIDKMISFCDIFIGISRAALEAMSSEKPVILAGVWSFIGILNESIIAKSISDNFTGRSFSQSATPEVLYKAIAELLSMSEEERTDIGKLGRQVVLEYYSSGNMAAATAQVYNEILSKGERR